MGRAGVPQKTTARPVDALAGWDACLRAQDRAWTDLDVIRDAHLAADDGAVSDSAAARDTGLRSDHHIAADGDVVSHVDEVIELRAPADARLFERAAIDGGVRANFDIVFDDESALLGKLHVLARRVDRAHSRSRPSPAPRPHAR